MLSGQSNRASQKCYCSPKLKIWGQTQQIPKLYAKKITQNFFQNFFSMFSFASKHLKFYYIAQYSRLRSTNFGSQCTHFWLEFFDDHYIFGILTCNIYNKILFLEQSDQFYSLLILALFLQILGQWMQKIKKKKISDHSENKILL